MELSYTNNDYLLPATSYVKDASRVRVDGKSIDEIRAEERKMVADLLPQAFCQYCNQEACEGGMVGSIQECETIRMLKDVIEEVVEEMKGAEE